MATLLGEDYVDEPLDWRLMDEAEPLSAALQPSQPAREPRKALDVSKGAPSAMEGGPVAGAPGPRSPMDPLKAALGTAADRRFASSIGMAADQLRQALAPPGYKDQGESFWARLGQQADRPVQELQAFQKQRGDEEDRKLKREGEGLDRQLRQQTIDMNRLGQEEMGRRREIEVAKLKEDAALRTRQNDLASPETRAAQEALAETAWGKALGPEKIKTLTAADINSGAVLRKNLREPDDALGWARLAQAREMGLLGLNAAQTRAETMATGKATEAAGKTAKEEGLLHVPGWSRAAAEGTIKPEEAKDFRESVSAYKTAKSYLDKMGDIRVEKGWLGGKLPGEAKGKIGTFRNAMLGTLNQMYKFGALDAGSTAVLQEMIPNEQDFLDQTFKGKMDALKSALDERIGSHGASLGYAPAAATEPKAPAKMSAAPATAATAPAGGPVKMEFPDGTTRMVAPGDVERMSKFGKVVPNG